MEEVRRNYTQLRASFWFLLGAIHDYKETVCFGENFYIDRVSLFSVCVGFSLKRTNLTIIELNNL